MTDVTLMTRYQFARNKRSNCTSSALRAAIPPSCAAHSDGVTEYHVEDIGDNQVNDCSYPGRCAGARKARVGVDEGRDVQKQKEPLWHVTARSLEHKNCTGIARPTQRQITNSTVLRASVVADNAAAASTLTEQLRLQAGVTCGKLLVRRAKEAVLFLRELSAVNKNLRTELHQDASGCFERAVIAIDPQHFANGQQVSGVDAAHMKHRYYNGVQIVLVARDGNSENKIAAVALAPKESAWSYFWFFGVLLDVGYPLRAVSVFCGRHARLVAAADTLSVRVHFCTRHIIGTI